MDRQAWTTPRLVSLDTGLEETGKFPGRFEILIWEDSSDTHEGES